MEREIDLYPGGHIEYAFKMHAKHEQTIVCNLTNSAAKSITLNKTSPSDAYCQKWNLTIFFGPIRSIEEIIKSGEEIHAKIFDILSLTLNTRISEARITGYGLAPQDGRGGIAHLLSPQPSLHATVSAECFSLSKETIEIFQRKLRRETSMRHSSLVSLFRHAITMEEPISQFLLLYLLLGENKNQKEIDNTILRIAPHTPKSKSPHGRPGGYETTYTRLRNELTHRAFNSLEKTRNEIMSILDSFKEIIREHLMEEDLGSHSQHTVQRNP